MCDDWVEAAYKWLSIVYMLTMIGHYWYFYGRAAYRAWRRRTVKRKRS